METLVNVSVANVFRQSVLALKIQTRKGLLVILEATLRMRISKTLGTDVGLSNTLVCQSRIRPRRRPMLPQVEIQAETV